MSLSTHRLTSFLIRSLAYGVCARQKQTLWGEWINVSQWLSVLIGNVSVCRGVVASVRQMTNVVTISVITRWWCFRPPLCIFVRVMRSWMMSDGRRPRLRPELGMVSAFLNVPPSCFTLPVESHWVYVMYLTYTVNVIKWGHIVNRWYIINCCNVIKCYM